MPNPSDASSQEVAKVVDNVTQQVCDRVRNLRKTRSWTLEQLSAASGVSRSMLSQIERGTANPTLAVAHRIAHAFNITLADLVDSPNTRSRIDVVKVSDEGSVFRDDPHCRIRTLSPLHLEKDVEFYEVRLRPQGILDSAPHFEGTREFLTIEKGSVRLIAGEEERVLGEGDSAHYPADVPHKIENTTDAEAVMFLVDIYSR